MEKKNQLWGFYIATEEKEQQQSKMTPKYTQVCLRWDRVYFFLLLGPPKINAHMSTLYIPTIDR